MKLKNKCYEKPNEMVHISLDNGHVSLHRYDDNKDEIILTSLIVKRKRKQGNGTKLMNRAEEIAKSLKAKVIYLQVKEKSWMKGWHERLGYKEFECDDNKDDMIWMKKEI